LTGRRLSLVQQAYLIREATPSASCRFRGDRLVCTVALQPTELSSVYSIQVRYEYGFRPATRVRDPVLHSRLGEPGLPHVYTGDELCLNLPGEWDSSMSIGHTIIPWTSEWLLYYEIWLSSGEWTGGGRHPPKAS
jgi:hypothetical protein